MWASDGMGVQLKGVVSVHHRNSGIPFVYARVGESEAWSACSTQKNEAAAEVTSSETIPQGRD